jgi:bifunctional DNA-binding transcriptional regulator/antitoxin component of YhaV-PrlF toxin-antitoxin module
MAHKVHVPSEQFSIRMGARGRLVLPSRLRRRIRLNDGDRIIATVDASGNVWLRSAKDAVDSCRGLFQQVSPGRILSEELIRERREEARREAED